MPASKQLPPLNNTGAVAGTYSNPQITVGADGRINSISGYNNIYFLGGFSSTSDTSGDVNMASGFNTIPLSIVSDPGNGFSNNIWTVPVSGLYLVNSKVRIEDNVTNGLSYGQGVHTSDIDGFWFSWFVTAPYRNGSFNSRIASFNQGDPLRLYTYFDRNIQVKAAELSIVLLFPS